VFLADAKKHLCSRVARGLVLADVLSKSTKNTTPHNEAISPAGNRPGSSRNLPRKMGARLFRQTQEAPHNARLPPSGHGDAGGSRFQLPRRPMPRIVPMGSFAPLPSSLSARRPIDAHGHGVRFASDFDHWPGAACRSAPSRPSLQRFRRSTLGPVARTAFSSDTRGGDLGTLRRLPDKALK
jgi:hypothetical protein